MAGATIRQKGAVGLSGRALTSDDGVVIGGEVHGGAVVDGGEGRGCRGGGSGGLLGVGWGCRGGGAQEVLDSVTGYLLLQG